MKKKQPILCDVDGVHAKWIEKVLRHCNERFNKNLSVNEIKKDIREYFPWDEDCEKLVQSHGFVSDLELMQDSHWAVEELRNMGENLIFVTSPYANAPTWAYDRTKWLERHFSISRDEIVFCHDKRYVDGKTLIDDLPRNIHDWNEYNNKSAILFGQPWNETHEYKNLNRITGWRSVIEFIKKNHT
jgi:5'(3')-deoxyribonucleotidase